MTRQDEQQLRARVAHVAADAASGTAGVAFLRPGLADLVRGMGGIGGAGRGSVPGVRVRRRTDPAGWEIQIQLAVRQGHRALDVTRGVRTAVESAVGEALGPSPAPLRVAVTVTTIT